MTAPRFTATDAAFRDAISRSRRRRQRRHAAAAGTTVAAAVAALSLSVTPGGSDSLRQNQPAAPPGIPKTSPARPSGPVEDPAGSGLPATGNRSAPAAGVRTPTVARPRPDGGPGQAPSTAEPSASPSEPSDISSPIELHAAAYPAHEPCRDTTGRTATGWCVQPPGNDFDGVSGQPTSLAVSLCRLPGFPAAVARFPSTAEAGFSLYAEQGGRRFWDHASQHPGTPREHTSVVQPGRCLVWTTTWNNRSDDGAALAPGSYRLRLAVLTDNIQGANRVTPDDDDYVYTVRKA